MNPTRLRAAHARLERIAEDVGRLQRTDAPGWLVDRLAENIQALDAILHPTAAELHQRFALISDGDVALDEAIRVVVRASRPVAPAAGAEALNAVRHVCGSNRRLRWADGAWLCFSGCEKPNPATALPSSPRRRGGRKHPPLSNPNWTDMQTGAVTRATRQELSTAYRLWVVHEDIRLGRLA